MQVVLNNPDLQRFIRTEIDAGTFANVEEMVEAALEQMKQLIDEGLDAETEAALDEAAASYERGEWMEFEQFKAEFKKRHSIP